MEEKDKNIKGITLISLVITIIVLIILAGVGISLTIGKNGLLNKAEQSKELTDIEKEEERLELIKAEVVMNTQGNLNFETYKKELIDRHIIEDDEIKKNEDDSIEVITDNGYLATIKPDSVNKGNVIVEVQKKLETVKIKIANVKTTLEAEGLKVEIDARRAEGATYNYYYKKKAAAEEEYIPWLEETKETITTITGIEEDVYIIKIVATNKNGTVYKEIEVSTKKVNSITLNPTQAEIREGKTINIEAVIEPSDANNKKLKWSSSDTTKAIVDENGKVTAVVGTEGGTVTITAEATDGSAVSATSSIYVLGNLEVFSYMKHKGITDITTFGFTRNSATGLETSYWNNRTDLWFGGGANAGTRLLGY